MRGQGGHITTGGTAATENINPWIVARRIVDEGKKYVREQNWRPGVFEDFAAALGLEGTPCGDMLRLSEFELLRRIGACEPWKVRIINLYLHGFIIFEHGNWKLMYDPWLFGPRLPFRLYYDPTPLKWFEEPPRR